MLRLAARSARCAPWLVRDSSNLARIKEVRERSGAPMHEVKAALVATGWNAEAALEELRTRGHNAASKKASRLAAEGLVGVASAGNVGVVVELNSETDFVARNPKFQALVSAVAASALSIERKELQGLPRSAEYPGTVELPLALLQSVRLDGKATVAESITALAAEVRENVRLRRAFWVSEEHSFIGAYAHGGSSRVYGRIGTLVALRVHDAATDIAASTNVEQLASQLAMHVAAIRPTYLSAAAVPAAVLAAQRAVFEAQAAASGKPAKILDKMVQGMMHKWYTEVCLLPQSFVMNDGVSVEDAVKGVAAKAGMPLSVASFVRLQVGEGIEREAKDFAAEVAAAARA